MKFEDTIETQVTERIMLRCFSTFGQNPIVGLKTSEYNQVYSFIHQTLTDLGLNYILRKDRDAVEAYKSNMRDKYQHKANSIRQLYPNGVFTKDKDGEWVGIDITLTQALKELCEMNSWEQSEQTSK